MCLMHGGALLSQLEAKAPELIIISAGFDAHADDPLASIEMQATDFYELTCIITEFADKVANGRDISSRRGYNLDALAASAEQHLCALQGFQGRREIQAALHLELIIMKAFAFDFADVSVNKPNRVKLTKRFFDFYQAFVNQHQCLSDIFIAKFLIFFCQFPCHIR